MKDAITVTQATDPWIEDRPVEIVERKGAGHPDSLCDGIAEAISREYTRWCQEYLGAPAHHNFDKVQLVAGAVSVGFGRGQMLRPMRIQIAGRGTTTVEGRAIPLDVLAIQAARRHLGDTLRHLDVDRHCVVNCYAGQGAGELARTVQQVTANDTSFGVAHWPLSTLEKTVRQTADFLNDTLLERLPIGEDVKVMGVRQGETMHLTCAAPLLARQVANVGRYREVKGAIRNAVATFAADVAGRPVEVDVNTADDEEEGSVYLTLTGTSAEQGDDGASGRGNRITGLITPYRSSSMEAVAGKNPISHVGKLYNVLALRVAQEIVANLPAVREAQVTLLSQIGRPLSDPHVAEVVVRCEDGRLPAGQRDDVAAILQNGLDNVDDVSGAIIGGEIALY